LYLSPVNVDGATLIKTGDAVFIEGDLPEIFEAGSVDRAGPLYATEGEPAFWDGLSVTIFFIVKLLWLLTVVFMAQIASITVTYHSKRGCCDV